MKQVIFLSLLFISAIAHSQVNLNLGLVAYYPFNGNANDVSGNNINGLVNNATLTTDRAGQSNSAYYFNGSTSYIQLPYSPLYNFAPNDSFTITVRVLPDQGYSWPAQSLVVKSPFNADFNLSAWNYGSYILNYQAMSGYAYTNALVGTTVFTGTPCWYNIVTTYKNGTWRLYINGVLEDSDLSQTRYILQDGPASKINFGRKGDSNGDWYKGKMDDIRIYHRVLNQEEINILSGCSNIAPCDTWLKTQTAGESIKVGDIDVSGNQITVEAQINRTAPYSGSYIYAGDIVSKHTDPSDANYLLRPNDAEITTTNGYFVTPAICDIELNKTYHVALVYNGTTLKFYRNGFLMSQVPASGNLYQNNLITSIGDWANYIVPVGSNFQGYINEVRIWNVARTQAQLQTYMNTSLPNPTTQAGLLGYYTFDNLLNKQGNATYNGSIAGTATINNTNTSCNFVADSCRIACNTWLSTPSQSSYVSVGDLDITGNKITVEANINRTQAYLPGTGNNTEGDVVSKHTDPTDINYLLRPNHAYITTTNGFFGTPDVCDLELNRNYHVAMVYDGVTLKFYRDGFLMSQVPATGNLFQNNLTTRIGLYPATVWNTQFIGYINEVRIWNVARTQSELQTYMNSSLPNPATQSGLQAYYTFDNLLNKQGNASWNGVLGGSASINATNSNCNFIPDSCAIIATPGISHIINDYTPVLALNPCNNKITVEDAIKFNTGDTVLMIQMKGAVIDSTNTATFGTVTDYKNSGNYEYNYVKNKTGNIIELKNKLTRQYDIPDGKVQLIRVPYYTSVTVTDTLTCLPWDGSKGGVLVFNVRDTIFLQANIDVTGKGFSGGTGYNSNNSVLSCFQNDYNYPSSSAVFAGLKGESIASIGSNIIRGKGAPACGGGGGLGHNSGGGGGGNAGGGGFGGYQLDACGSSPFDNRGIGGHSLVYSTASNKIFLGGGGGAGNADNPGNIPPTGGNGGGIAIINAGYLKSGSNKIRANGNSGIACSIPQSPDCHDGMAGGGAGGCVLVNVNQIIDNTVIEQKGGNGVDMIGDVALGGRIGAGGGGGGGVLFIKAPALPGFVNSINPGGINGVLTQDGNNAYGATPGTTGLNLFNLVLPVDTVLFKPNIDSVRIKDSSTSCLAFDFHGFGYTNTNAISSWDWHFGDGGTANSQNTSHTYAGAGTFPVQLIVTDINGCKDSITQNVVSNTLSVDAGRDSTFCNSSSVSVQLQGTGTGNYSWTPAVYLNNSTIANPVATVNTTTTFYLTITGPSGCTGRDSVTINVNASPVVKTLNDTSVCKGAALILTTTTGLTGYHWSPGIYVSDSTISNPNFTDTVTRTLIVTGTATGGCAASDTITVTVKPLPVVKTIPDTIICSTQNITLTTTGAVSYSWTPGTFLSNTNTANPVFSGNSGNMYYVTGTGANGCTSKDSVQVTVNNPNSLLAPPGKSLCLKDSVHLNGNNGNSVLYLWSPATYLSNPAIIDPVANPPVTTLYSVTITDQACNYDSTFTVSVNVMPLPVINADKSNDITCALASSHLTASGGISYAWNASSTLSSTSIANPVATPTDNTQYIVTGTDNNGCRNKDSVIVLVKTGANAYGIPNSFTPNGDGLNDCFGIKHWGSDATDVYFIIYNRFGEKVFETRNVNICWDGTYKGSPADAGTYVYYATAKTACGLLVKKGNVLLIR